MSRPEKPIDWKLVDELLIAGCMGTEIAPHFDLHVNTFYDRVAEHHGIGFTEYCSLKRAQGDAILRHVQFKKALKGDNTLLIWLGKNRLKQSDSAQESGVDAKTEAHYTAVIQQLNELQKSLHSERKIADNSISNEQ